MATKNAIDAVISKVRLPFHLPWFIFDIGNKQIITTTEIPGDISDAKGVVLSETPIPGLNFAPISTGGGANRKVSFTLPLLKRNNTVGNVLILKQFDNLRNQVTGFHLNSKLFKAAKQFTPTPKVLYYWGTGSVPLEYYVAKCDFVHSSRFVNALGFPQYSQISLELWLDETSPLYRAEEDFRKVASILGMAENVAATVGTLKGFL